MRLRNVPDAQDRLERCANFIQSPEEYKGEWNNFFSNNNPIYLEIGSGKGNFITTLARNNPQINYIALERYPTVLIQLIRKVPEDGYKNLAVMNVDAEKLEEFFEVGEVDKLYLNFSDPWPKKRHAKRRLTSPNFLNIYKKVLGPGSSIEFKTDNREFFDYSVEEFKNQGYTLTKLTYDLYNSDMVEGNVPTEYEEKFHALGTPINKLIAIYKTS